MNAVRVLLAEDGCAMGRQLRGLLCQQFDVIGLVQDGESLVQASVAMLPDVIVTDIAMPGLSGLEAARRLRAQRPVLGVVFITVHAELQMVRQAMGVGVCSYVLKADAGDDLLVAVQAALEGTPFVSRSLQR
ncbi:response regulator transcription factor [Stenotrophomonas sp. BIGb0135]|uniref:response regulator n=1 Tax=Stenotrophomonas sp. BIGb0135 TaxID=2940620 RepID=UPI00216A77C3|nr:response regulator transcription factor [Stenotrophomonas sp. BIGb0135]MCS4233228.1 DNA-binding NarL/FixJ family response regulator [Stenotrophomonas sp. BIGb0135]